MNEPTTLYPLTADEFGNPYAVPFPTKQLRDVGAAPFWRSGDVVRWHFRRHDYAMHGTEVIQPVRVVEDSSRGTVVWLPGGSATVHARLVGFEDINPHEIAPELRFHPTATERVMVPGQWHGTGVLRVVPADLPFSVWLFFAPDGEFKAWYVNLEHRHRKGAPMDAEACGELLTADHILDLVISPDGHMRLKDEDELAAAVQFGQFTEEIAAQVRANADVAKAAYVTRHWAFCADWTRWYCDVGLAEPENWAALGPETVAAWLAPAARFVGQD